MIKFLAVLSVIGYVASTSLSMKTIQGEWSTFKTNYNKNYDSLAEDLMREKIFATKRQHIAEHNERFRQGLETFEIAVNKFTDFTEEEMRPYTNGLRLPEVIPQSAEVFTGHPIKIPAHFDWRDYGVVTPVKDQGGCGSCWAFSVVGVMEAHMKLVHGTNLTVSLSEQQIVDCSDSNRGCNGGWASTAFSDILFQGGLESDRDYPYEAQRGACRFEVKKIAVKIKTHGYLADIDENTLAQLVYQYGPVVVAINADGDFGGYSNGVYYDPNCSKVLTHSVVVVGYGTERGEDYWIVKNSWGPDYGQRGYIKMARNRDNHCGIATSVVYPVVV